MQISEIFRSIQGEGREQGRITTFIRSAGCNLRCRWCDTRYAWDGGTEMDIPGILERVEALGCRRICVTGGEPLLQDDLPLLVETLFKGGYAVGIETNGTLDFAHLQPYAAICMDVKCPSSGEESDLSLLARITARDSVKFVVGGRADLAYAEGVIARYPIAGEVFVSPVFGSDYAEIAAYILEHDLPVRLQLQLHRIIGVR
ncbi:MAG: radical SAM protein [Methanomicrobiales archaeon]|nr:radical SAM protein [Methanomicrobiales archaeon]MDI6876800.1 radical SAM protein [Methanomicrobiales archaeon]